MRNPSQAATHEISTTQADPAALEFLNTVALVEGKLVDSLQSDDDVLRWMARAGLAVSDASHLKPASLLRAARSLREMTRVLVERRKAGKRAEVESFNMFLASARSHLALVAGKNGHIQAKRQWKQITAEQVLAPLAEAVADFVSTANFDLVRPCESDACVLWFYDRTKSHRRRWCSMTTCGNRHKVAAFRERNAQF